MNKYKDRVSLVEEYLDRVSLNKDIESFYKDKTILVTRCRSHWEQSNNCFVIFGREKGKNYCFR